MDAASGAYVPEAAVLDCVVGSFYSCPVVVRLVQDVACHRKDLVASSLSNIQPFLEIRDRIHRLNIARKQVCGLFYDTLCTYYSVAGGFTRNVVCHALKVSITLNSGTVPYPAWTKTPTHRTEVEDSSLMLNELRLLVTIRIATSITYGRI